MPSSRETNRLAMQHAYRADPEKFRDRQRRWRLINPSAYKAKCERELIKNRLRRQTDPAYKAHLASIRRRWRAKRPPTLRLYQREYRRHWREALREEILRYYAQGQLVCVLCGFADQRALTIDHVHDNGSTERRSEGYPRAHFYAWLKSKKFPAGYQTLCGNCQAIKEWERKRTSRFGPNEFREIRTR